MIQWLYGRKVLLLCCFISIVSAAAAAWLTHDTWLGWYYVRGLRHSSDADRDLWVRRVTSLGDAAVPQLVAQLKQDDPAACANAQLALRAFCDQGRRTFIYDELSRTFDRLSLTGQQSVFKLYTSELPSEDGQSKECIELMLHPLQSGAQSACKDVRGEAYQLLMMLVRRDAGALHYSIYRELVRRGLNEDDPLLRARAVCAAAIPEIGLQDHVVPLLHDSAPEVRRAALLALGSATMVIRDDDLLPWLNDGDAEVRRLCELALESRGIPREGIRLARLTTHPDVEMRQQAIRELLFQSERDPTEWFRRLSHDPSPSVQIAAIRAASRAHIDLRDRIEEMVQSDQSLTVRQLAAYYLAQRD